MCPRSPMPSISRRTASSSTVDRARLRALPGGQPRSSSTKASRWDTRWGQQRGQRWTECTRTSREAAMKEVSRSSLYIVSCGERRER